MINRFSCHVLKSIARAGYLGFSSKKLLFNIAVARNVIGSFVIWNLVVFSLQAAEIERLNNVDIEIFNNNSLADTSHKSISEILKDSLSLTPQEFFSEVNVITDKYGGVHYRLQQYYQDIPIWGKQTVVHLRQGQIYRLSGELVRKLDQFSLSPVIISSDQAMEIAKSWLKKNSPQPRWHYSNEKSQLYLVVSDSGEVTSVYQISFLASNASHDLTRPFFHIDSSSGTIARQWEGLNYLEATGPGGNLKTGRYEYGTDFDTLDVTQVGADCLMQNAEVTTYDDSAPGDPIHSFPCSENTYKEINGAFSPINDIHFFSGVVVDMYKAWVGEPPLTTSVYAVAHWGTVLNNLFQGKENAAWDGSKILLGDGRFTYYPYTTLDIISHEIAHGFTERYSGLIYADQSGGINESFSDIAGEGAEVFFRGQNDWLVGFEMTVNPEDSLRYFAEPTRDGKSIDHISSYEPGMDVHFSSGIFNKAFYLLSNTSNWDIRKAFDTFLLANQAYWQPDTTFHHAVCGIQSSATDLGFDWIDVAHAFAPVGVACDDVTDTDGDLLPNFWEITQGLDFLNSSDADIDSDNDGLTNRMEYIHNTDPKDDDSDDDNLSDSVEIELYGTSPLDDDSDDDGMPDGWEITHSLDPLLSNASSDDDSDGFSNFEEYFSNTEPNNAMSVPVHLSYLRESFENGLSALWERSNHEINWEVANQNVSDGDFSLEVSYGAISGAPHITMTQLFAEGFLGFDYETINFNISSKFSVYLDDNEIFDVSFVDSRGRFIVPISEGIHSIRFQANMLSTSNILQRRIVLDNIIFSESEADVQSVDLVTFATVSTTESSATVEAQLTNSGKSTADTIMLSADLGSSGNVDTYISDDFNTTNCELTGQSLSCPLDSLPANATAFLKITILLSAPPTYTIELSASSDTYDLNEDDNTFIVTDENTSLGSSPCAIEVAAAGTPTENFLDTLRNYRDNVLMTTNTGRYLVDLYYRYEGTLAGLLQQHESLRQIVGHILSPLIHTADFLYKLKFHDSGQFTHNQIEHLNARAND